MSMRRSAYPTSAEVRPRSAPCQFLPLLRSKSRSVPALPMGSHKPSPRSSIVQTSFGAGTAAPEFAIVWSRHLVERVAVENLVGDPVELAPQAFQHVGPLRSTIASSTTRS